MAQYKVVNGTSYHVDTDEQVIKWLETSRERRQRLVLDYGNTETGQSWGDDIEGHIGRSTGSSKIPLMIHNSRSTGGPGVLDHCIVKIQTAKGKHTVYEHPNYKPPTE
jgi:hypothetical protein